MIVTAISFCWCWMLMVFECLLFYRGSRRDHWPSRTMASGCVMIPVVEPTTCTGSTEIWVMLEPWHSVVSIWAHSAQCDVIMKQCSCSISYYSCDRCSDFLGLMCSDISELDEIGYCCPMHTIAKVPNKCNNIVCQCESRGQSLFFTFVLLHVNQKWHQYKNVCYMMIKYCILSSSLKALSFCFGEENARQSDNQQTIERWLDTRCSSVNTTQEDDEWRKIWSRYFSKASFYWLYMGFICSWNCPSPT